MPDRKRDLIRGGRRSLHRARRGRRARTRRPCSPPDAWARGRGRATSRPAPPGSSPRAARAAPSASTAPTAASGPTSWRRCPRRVGAGAAALRGAPQGPAGLVHQPRRPGREPVQRGAARGDRRWRRCGSALRADTDGVGAGRRIPVRSCAGDHQRRPRPRTGTCRWPTSTSRSTRTRCAGTSSAGSATGAPATSSPRTRAARALVEVEAGRRSRCSHRSRR